MARTPRQHQPPDTDSFTIRNLFGHLAKYTRENKLESLALGSSLTLGGLMMTTSLVSPLLSSPWGAAALLGGSIALLLQNSKTTVANTLGFGNKLGATAMTMGLVVGSLNTIPEVAVSLSALQQGAYDLGLGNVVGSHIAHTLLILGVTAAAVGISKAQDLSWKFNTYMMAGAAGLFGAQLTMDHFSPYLGAAMMGLGGYYIWKRFKGRNDDNGHNHADRHQDGHDHDHDHDHNEDIGLCLFHDHDDDDDIRKAKERPRWFNAMLAGGGMLGLLAAAQAIVASGVNVASSFNTSALGFDLNQATIGAIVIALGTAAPEIAISIEAIRKKHADFAIGNVLGCSITNTLIAGGALSLVGGFADVAIPQAFHLDTTMGLLNFATFAGTTALLTGTLLATKGAISRVQGALAVTAYAAYVGASLYLSNGDLDNIHRHGHPDALEHKEQFGRQDLNSENKIEYTPVPF